MPTRRTSPARWVATGAGLGVAVYVGLLAFHLVKFGTLEHRVPNVKVIIHVEGGYGFVGYGDTWELTALNGAAHALGYIKRVDAVSPQGTRFHGEPVGRTRGWNPAAWVALGVLGYALAGAVASGVLWLGVAAGRVIGRRRSQRSEISIEG